MNIYIQPSVSGLTYTRSPVVAVVNGLSTGNTYLFQLYYSSGTSYDLSTSLVKVAINRIPDLDGKIKIDYSTILHNAIVNDINFTSNNALFSYFVLVEYTSTGSINLVRSDTSSIVNGYTYYSSTGALNITEKTNEYIMNSQIPSVDYILPYAHYELSRRYTGIMTHVIYWWYDIVGDEFSDQEMITTLGTGSTTALSQIKTFNCGYKDFYENFGDSVDITKPIYLDFYSGPATTGRTLIERYKFIPDNGCVDNVTTLQFMNKWGVWDFLHFTGRRDTGLKTTNELYKYNKLSSTLTYQPEFGQQHKYMVQGKGTLILNTGWLDDVKNEKMEQLLLSEFVFDYDTRMPYIITDKDVRYKTGKYDKQIQYTITLDEAFDKINSII